MVKFQRIFLKNFLSVGNAGLDIQLDRAHLTLITAVNGSGKSTILDAICFALFNQAYRKINKPQLVNSINGKHCETIIEFTAHGRQYKVVRGIKPSKFEIWENGVMLNQDASGRDYQEILEKQILKLNYTAFTQVVVMGTNNYTPFMKLKTGERRDFIENLLDIKIFSVMNDVLKEKFTNTKDEAKRVDYELDAITDKIELQKGFIESKIKDHETRVTQLQEEINRNNDKTAELQTQLDRVKGECAALKEESQHFEAIQSKVDELRTMLKKIEQNMARQLQEKQEYEGVDTCPTCQQKLPEERRNAVLNDYGKKIETYAAGVTQLSAKLAGMTEQLVGYDEIADALVKKSRELNELSQTMYGLSLLNQKARKELGELETVTSGEEEIQKLKDYLEKKKLLEGERSNVNEELSYWTVIQNMLKDSGIKARIIAQYIPAINKLINKFLSDLDFFCQFTIDEQFNEKIKSRYRDEFTYESFSAGERQRIDLSMMFAWRELSRLKNSTNTNLLFMDEILDASLDETVIDNLFRLLYDMRDCNIFVVSHRTGMDERFRHVIRLQKQNNFTVMI